MTPALPFPMVAPVPAQVLTLRPRLPAVAAPDLHRRPAPLSQPRPQKNLAPGSTSRHPRSTNHPYISRRSAFASSVPPWHLQFVCPLFSYSYELLFPQLPSFHNHPHCPGGVGYELQSHRSVSRCLCGNPNLLALCFHILTNCFFRKSFILTTIRIARGCGVPLAFCPTSNLRPRISNTPRFLVFRAPLTLPSLAATHHPPPATPSRRNASDPAPRSATGA